MAAWTGASYWPREKGHTRLAQSGGLMRQVQQLTFWSVAEPWKIAKEFSISFLIGMPHLEDFIKVIIFRSLCI